MSARLAQPDLFAAGARMVAAEAVDLTVASLQAYGPQNHRRCEARMSVLRVLFLGAGVQSTTLALMAAHGEIGPMPHITRPLSAVSFTGAHFE